jgi:hypothetical protein
MQELARVCVSAQLSSVCFPLSSFPITFNILNKLRYLDYEVELNPFSLQPDDPGLSFTFIEQLAMSPWRFTLL